MSLDSTTGYWTFPHTGLYKIEFNLLTINQLIMTLQQLIFTLEVERLVYTN